MALSVVTTSPAETEALGNRLGALLIPGDFVALCGELGGGKTCFTRGVVAVLAPESAHLVASPTFAIMNEYPGTVPVFHFDFYRLASEADVEELGFKEFFGTTGICIVEWSERLGALLPPEHLSISFEHESDDRRTITLYPHGEHYRKLISALCNNT